MMAVVAHQGWRSIIRWQGETMVLETYSLKRVHAIRGLNNNCKISNIWYLIWRSKFGPYVGRKFSCSGTALKFLGQQFSEPLTYEMLLESTHVNNFAWKKIGGCTESK